MFSAVFVVTVPVVAPLTAVTAPLLIVKLISVTAAVYVPLVTTGTATSCSVYSPSVSPLMWLTVSPDLNVRTFPDALTSVAPPVTCDAVNVVPVGPVSVSVAPGSSAPPTVILLMSTEHVGVGVTSPK